VTQPKILLYDIETTPNLAYIWGKYEQNALGFVKNWELLSFAYKWLGQSKVTCVTKTGNNDLSLVKALAALFAEADILVAHNGDQFDFRKVKARMVYHKLKPTKIPSSVDTCKIAKTYFNFSGNGLNDLGEYLRLGRKVKHEGFDLWLGCMQDNKAAWAKMIRYNKQDVVLLEKVYKRFLPWITNHPNVKRILDPYDRALAVCPTCRSRRVQRRGFQASASVLCRQQWQCQSCARWFLTRLPNKKEK
jgi:hypothetical protein